MHRADWSHRRDTRGRNDDWIERAAGDGGRRIGDVGRYVER